MPRIITKATKITKIAKKNKKKSSVFSFVIFVSFVTFVMCTSPSAQNQPTFRSDAQIVEVDVRVFDKDGRFVADLTRDDFELLENGRPQPIQSVYVVGEKATSAGTSGAVTVPLSGVPAVAQAGARQTWVFVFDLQHLTPGAGFERAREAVGNFIRDRFHDGDLAGVVAGTRMVNNRLTSIRAELVAAVGSVKPLTDARSRQVELTREWPRLLDELEAVLIAQENGDALQRAVSRACSDDPSSCATVPPVDAVREKARRILRDVELATSETLTAVNGLASGLARVPGPKTIVFLSEGFVVQQVETTLRGVVGQAARAGARIYAIDVRGLNRGRGAGIIDQRAADHEMGGPARFDALEDGPNSLAVDTGGLMIRNENNIGRALGQIAADANRYYVLGYRPADATFDGKFRTIEVRVRRSGTRVRARRGYLALAPAKMLQPQPIAAPLSSARLETPPPTPAGGSPANAPAPLPPLATAPGRIEAPASSAAAGTVRVRPGAGARVEALSRGEIAATPDSAAKKGWDAYQRGDLDAAVPLLQTAAAQPEARPWVFYTLGFAQIAVGRPADAAASWERVRQAAPEFEPVYIDLADAYVQLSDLTRALEVLRAAEQGWAADAEIQNGIGVIHVRRGALDEAIAAFSKAVSAAPGDALGYFNLARVYELRYARGRRFVSSQKRWVAPDEDRRNAAENYQRCVQLGGPYATQAAEALNRLEWSKP